MLAFRPAKIPALNRSTNTEATMSRPTPKWYMCSISRDTMASEKSCKFESAGGECHTSSGWPLVRHKACSDMSVIGYSKFLVARHRKQIELVFAETFRFNDCTKNFQSPRTEETTVLRPRTPSVHKVLQEATICSKTACRVTLTFSCMKYFLAGIMATRNLLALAFVWYGLHSDIQLMHMNKLLSKTWTSSP